MSCEDFIRDNVGYLEKLTEHEEQVLNDVREK
jgi:hypothetical protein